MKRNLKLLFIVSIISIPVWWGVDFLSTTTTSILTEWELQTNPEILAAYATQKVLDQKLLQAYPLPTKGTTKLSLHARGAQSTLVKKDGTTKLLFSQRHESPFLIASLTKLMTALVAVEKYTPTQQVTITPEILLVEGESGQLKQWEVFSIQDLLYLALIESSNDAAEALTTPLGFNNFIAEMNKQASILAMDTALFANPTGLDDKNGSNYASSQDLTTLVIHIKKNYPQVFDILSQQQFPISTADGTFHHNLINTNELLGYKEWPTKILGGKTGWTPAAKQSLILVTEAPDKKGYIVNIILGSDDRFGEMKKLLRWTLHSYQWN